MTGLDDRQTRVSLGRRLHSGFNLGAGYVASYLPRFSSRSLVRRLVARAALARDARQFRTAASLYEEALNLAPGRVHLHIQCGHMFKEGGDLIAAERHYRIAEQALPDDADLALQLGHFLKIAMRPDEAEQAYAHALLLRPGWEDAAGELARIRGSIGSDPLPAGASANWVVPELLPHPVEVSPSVREHIRVLRLAPRRRRASWGMAKTLQGIEAVRGYCVSVRALTGVEITLNGRPVARHDLQANAVNGTTATKYVFNLWHDFSNITPGRYVIALRMLDGEVVVRTYSDQVNVAPPEAATPELLASDAFIPKLEGLQAENIAAAICAMPSAVRSARRTVLPDKVATILVQRADQLGDLICSEPAIRRLRELFPSARLIGLLTAANVDFGRRLKLFDEVVTADFAEDGVTGRRVMPIEAQLRLRQQLTSLDIDIAIDLCENSDSRPLLLLSGARFLYGFKPREWPWLSAGIEMNAADLVNKLEMMAPARKILALVEALGSLRMPPMPAARERQLPPALAAAYGLDPAVPYVILHSGARLAHSRWPGFVDLAERLASRDNLSILFLRDDEAAACPTPSENIALITGRLPTEDFDALLTACGVFVGNDSGVKHLAALHGVPVVSLHMARLNWSEWGQEGDGLIISRRVPCAGCGIHAHPEDCGRNFTCIRDIEVEEVRREVVGLLARNSKAHLGKPAEHKGAAPSSS